MCGIIGTLPSTGKHLLQYALGRLAHRGPDGEGVWQEQNGAISLGHRLLSIVGERAEAAQPMHYGHLSMVYNGEIYNYRELRHELARKGYEFKTNTDSEVILVAYQCWGPDCLLRFNGMWALAIWNNTTRQLFLSRDRFGKKPLFYAVIKGQFIFASEMKAIMPFLEEHQPAKNFARLVDGYDQYESTEDTLVESIKRFPAGHYGIYTDGQLKLTRYWDTLDHLVEVPTDYGQQVEQFRELLMDATRMRLQADVKVGASLSGGLDSSSVVATIKKNIDLYGQGQFDKAFVATFPGSQLDEADDAALTLQHLALPGKFMEISGQEALGTLESDLYYFEDIYRTPPSPMMQLYSSFRQDKTLVSLDGHGPDELLSGYGNFPFMAFLDMPPYNIKGIQNVLQTYRQLHPEGANIHKALSTGPLSYVKTHIWNALEEQKQDTLSVADDKRKHGEQLQVMGHFNYGLYKLFHYSIFPTLLRNYDRYAMRHGVEVRMPFTDHRLVSFCFSLPWQSKLRDQKNKAILRDAVAPLLGEGIAYRKNKIGFQSPLPQWIKGPWKEYLTDTVSSQDFRQCTLIHPVKVEVAFQRILQAHDPSIQEAEEFWLKLSPYLWEKTFFKNSLNMYRP